MAAVPRRFVMFGEGRASMLCCRRKGSRGSSAFAEDDVSASFILTTLMRHRRRGRFVDEAAGAEAF
jgi:hypothetical protein